MDHESQVFVPAILVACKKRTYSLYQVARTATIFHDRSALLEYESALPLEASVHERIESYDSMWRERRQKERIIAEKQIVDLYMQVNERFLASLSIKRTIPAIGLERFEAGWL